jgi:hypothetical protein
MTAKAFIGLFTLIIASVLIIMALRLIKRMVDSMNSKNNSLSRS